MYIQILEEEVVEAHNTLLLSMENWLQQDSGLLAMTNEVDYDQDGKWSLDFFLTIYVISPAFSLRTAAWRYDKWKTRGIGVPKREN